MQPVQEPPPGVIAQRSRRRPPRQRSTEPIPLPEPSARARSIRLQDVLAAQQRAIEERINEGLRQVREFAAELADQVAEERFQAVRRRLEGIDRALQSLAEDQKDLLHRLAEAQRAVVEDLGARTGRGVVAVARVLQEDMEGIRTSIRSMHRTLAWEGLGGGSRADEPVAEDRT